MKPAIIAHRGASALAKYENTIEAFQLAIDLNVDYVEFDIRKTYDDKLIVFHNADINGKPISSLTYRELCEITAADGYVPPLLSQVVDLCKGNIKLDIELKETGYEKRVIDIVLKSYAYRDFFIKSFHDTAIFRVKQYDHNIITGLLVGKKHASPKRRLHELFPKKRLSMCKADFISPNYFFCFIGYIKRMHRMGIQTLVWTVNNEKQMKRCIRLGADGIITDRPDLALKLLRDT
ncbi:MAG: glycerophosphodiester phosphodiesterase [Clostridium sp.]|nr:glycerophosphodiester phosphodiesterase [Clostridium sp.]MCM1397846.1 glycerophosphodiester phosphodiesterase [Clostridium sp.]MCM1459086.1 glycerophosphodiester phosphodiesterase [Bacteroides sp.]